MTSKCENVKTVAVPDGDGRRIASSKLKVTSPIGNSMLVQIVFVQLWRALWAMSLRALFRTTIQAQHCSAHPVQAYRRYKLDVTADEVDCMAVLVEW